MNVHVLSGEGAFAQLESVWDMLAGRGMTDTPFQTLAYQRSWWRHLHPSGASLHTFVVGDQADPSGIACLFLADGSWHFNGCIEETDYLDLIATVADAEAVWSKVLDALESDAVPPWVALDLCNIPERSATRGALQRLAETRGYTFDESIIEVCPIIQLPADFEAYLESLDSKERRELNRKLRRAEGMDVVTTAVGPDDDIDQAIDAFLTLLQKSMFEKRDWLNEGRRAHFHESGAAAHRAGLLQLLFSEVDGRKAAGLFNFVHRGRVWVYNSGLDPEAFGSLSLGVVLTASAIERSIGAGYKEFDFLRGREEYKYRFGAVDSPIYRIHMERKAG